MQYNYFINYIILNKYEFNKYEFEQITDIKILFFLLQYNYLYENRLEWHHLHISINRDNLRRRNSEHLQFTLNSFVHINNFVYFELLYVFLLIYNPK